MLHNLSDCRILCKLVFAHEIVHLVLEILNLRCPTPSEHLLAIESEGNVEGTTDAIAYYQRIDTLLGLLVVDDSRYQNA